MSLNKPNPCTNLSHSHSSTLHSTFIRKVLDNWEPLLTFTCYVFGFIGHIWPLKMWIKPLSTKTLIRISVPQHGRWDIQHLEGTWNIKESRVKIKRLFTKNKEGAEMMKRLIWYKGKNGDKTKVDSLETRTNNIKINKTHSWGYINLTFRGMMGAPIKSKVGGWDDEGQETQNVRSVGNTYILYVFHHACMGMGRCP